MSEAATEQAEEKEIEDEQVVDAQPEKEEVEEQPAENVETTDQAEKDSEAEDKTGEEALAEEEELVIEIEGESPTQEEEKEEAPEWVKNTRKENRELNKQNKAQAKRIAELEGKGKTAETEIPSEPDLWSDEINGDAELFKTKLRERDSLLAAAATRKKTADDEQKLVDDEVKGRIAKYDERKIAIGKSISDYDEHVSEAEGKLTELQRNSIAYYFKEGAAEVMYYLGKKPDLLKEIAAIKDPTEMLLAVGEIRSKVKVSKRKPTTKPEEIVRGQSKVTGKDAHLDRLEEAAAKDGDRTKINAYKRELREKARAN